MTIPQSILASHALYCATVAMNSAPNMAEERLWWEWAKAGFKDDDLQCVMRHLLREIKRDKRNLGALKLSNLLDPIRFKEDLIVARLAQKLKSDAFKTEETPRRTAMPADPARERAALEQFRRDNAEALRKYRKEI